MDIDLSALNLSSAREQIRSGRLSPIDLTNACLDRIGRLNPQLNAFITITRESAQEQAGQAEMLLRRAPSNLDQVGLLGIPLAEGSF